MQASEEGRGRGSSREGARQGMEESMARGQRRTEGGSEGTERRRHAGSGAEMNFGGKSGRGWLPGALQSRNTWA